MTYCKVLLNDGMRYGDYVEQLTYLPFIKMADERSRPPYAQPSPIPAECGWPTLLARDGDALFDHCLALRTGGARPFWGCVNFPRCRHIFYAH